MDKEIQVNKDHIFTYKFYNNFIQIVPTSATVTVYDNGGTSLQTGSGSIDSDGTITYTFLATNNDTIDKNYKVVLSYVYNSITIDVVKLFDVVYYPLENLTIDSDLYLYLPDLRTMAYEREGETDNTGTLSTLQDDMLKSDDRDYTGGKVEIFVSNTKVHDADITSYSKTTGVVNFSPSYSTTIATNLKYIIRTSYSTLITEAFEEYVIKDLRQRIGIASGYIDSFKIKRLVCFKALALYCFSSAEDKDSKWYMRYEKFAEMYSDELIPNVGSPSC